MIRKNIWCEDCGMIFEDEATASKHGERNCIPYGVGDRVEFLFDKGLGSIRATGTITMFSNPISSPAPGKRRVIRIHSDIGLFKPDIMDMIQTGYDVCVLPQNIIRKLPVPKTA